MSLIHSSTRRPRPLTQKDYDHEISLQDNTRPRSQPSPSHHTRSQSVANSPSQQGSLVPSPSDTSSRRHSDAFLQPKSKKGLRHSVNRPKYAKWQKPEESDHGGTAGNADGITQDAEASTADRHCEASPERGRLKTPKKSKPEAKAPQTEIDVLYENQRGGFLCGFALFSSNALGFLDTAPWTNIANKTSATNITNAQCPDPSWQWSWPEWSINRTEDVDDEGWEYAFAFGKPWGWTNNGKWWKSCVRRRAWIRQRVKKNSGYRSAQESHMLNDDYFTIHSKVDTRSVSRTGTSRGRSPGYRRMSGMYSVAQPLNMGEQIDLDDIRDIPTLMVALKFSRIDREKMEAVESFIKNGGDELYYLQDRMHDVMGMFIFQASRRLLLSHLIKIFDEATDREQDALEAADLDEAEKATRQRRLENLKSAIKAADEEVKRLEFWSDVKEMVVAGETANAASVEQGWGPDWVGLDESGPQDVVHDDEACRDYGGEIEIGGLHDSSEDRMGNGNELEELRNKTAGRLDRKGNGMGRGREGEGKEMVKEKGKGKESVF